MNFVIIVVDYTDYTTLYFIVFLDSVMDIKATDSADNLKFRNCFSKFKDLMLLRFYSIWWYTGSIYNLTSLSKEINKNIKFVMEFSAKASFKYIFEF